MTTLFTIELTINMPDGGRRAKQLLNLYLPDMPEDILAAALQLCNASEALLARKFAGLSMKRAEAWTEPSGSLTGFALLTVSGEDAAFIRQVIAQYMDGFAASLKAAAGRYFPREHFPPEIPLQPASWTAEVR